MRFRTKLIITSLAIVVVPLILALGTFLVVGRYILYDQKVQEYSSVVDYGMVSDPGGTFAKMTDNLVVEINLTRSIYPNILEDGQYLQDLDERIASRYSYILVKKDDKIYYVASRARAKEVIDELPGYGTGIEGVYYTRSRHLVRQYDFVFSDGDPGSLYIISGIRTAFTTSIHVGRYYFDTSFDKYPAYDMDRTKLL